MIAYTFPKSVTDFSANAVTLLCFHQGDITILAILYTLKNTQTISKITTLKYPLHEIGTSPLFLCLLNILSEISGNQ